ncbi:MAG: DUF6259 domain-containing protein [Planctomycetota bacterium]|nr:DUF6259 domain-containing protein [Planctomycetota bacterium]
MRSLPGRRLRGLWWIVALAMLCLGAGASASSVDASEVALRFDRAQGCLVSLLDKHAGHDHIARDRFGSLWILELPEQAGGTLSPEHAQQLDYHRDEHDSHQLRLSWSGFGRDTMPDLCVSVDVRFDPAVRASRFSIAVQGLDGVVPLVVRFPRIGPIAPQESEVLAVPNWMGEKTTQARQILSPSPGRAHRREFAYPGILSMQCMAFYRENGPGLYLAADDIEARSKSFAAFGDVQGGVSLEVCHFPGADPAAKTVYEPGYDVLVGLFEGDWITVAQRYRDWALQQLWATESRLKRGRTPDWVTKTGFWVWNRGHSDGVLLPAAAMQDYLGVPVSVFWHWWHGCAYDVNFPEYLPPREGTDAFRLAVRQARQKGLNPIVYMNQRLWGMTAESWDSRQAERYAVKKPDGTIQPEVYNTFTRSPMASMCMGTAFWRDTYAGLSETVYNDLGVSGIYMDQACSSLVCYDTEHGHPPGGGTYWMEGFRALESDIRRRCPGIGLAGEGCGEAWLGHLDLMLSLQVSQERYAAPGLWEPIPFFHAVYHGYVALYGNYASLTRPPYDPLWPKESAPQQPLQLLDEKFRYQFRLEQARSFVWGQQPCLSNFLPEHLVEREADLAYLRRLVQLRQAALPYLLHGTFVRPPRMDIPEMEIDMSRLSIYAGQQGAVQEYRKRVPQYLAGAWRADDGGVAVVLANIADVDHEIRCTLSREEHGLPAQGQIYKRCAGSRKEMGRFENGRATIADTLAPAGAVLYEVVRSME